LVVPAYNEERRLPTSIRDIRSFMPVLGVNWELICVIEKSTDQTVVKATEAAGADPHVQVIDNKVQRGKGYAVKSGMLRARGDFVFFMDADLSTPLSEIVKFMAEFAADPQAQVLIGSRAHAKSQIIKRQSLFRQTLGRTFNKFVRIFGVEGLEDTQCGFKAFRRQVVAPIFERQTLDGFAFDVEILMLAEEMGLKIRSIPVQWVNSPDSKVRILIDPLKMLWDLIRIRSIVRRTLRAQPLAAKLS